MKLIDVEEISDSALLDDFANHLAVSGYLDEETGEVSPSKREVLRKHDAFCNSLISRLEGDARRQIEKGRR